MIQDIAPVTFDNSYRDAKPLESDFALVYRDQEILMIWRDDAWQLPLISDVSYTGNEIDFRYAFSLDGKAAFLVSGVKKINSKMEYHRLQLLRTLRPMWIAFAGITGSQLYRFYRNTKYCGHCGSVMIHSSSERAMECPACHRIVYPAISPAVIVAVTKDDKLLMTKYANRENTNYALIAGFAEIGETLEDCVKREVKEEVGLEVDEIRYYKSQPWSFSDSLLAGFFARCIGSDEIAMDQNELAVAEWVKREDIPEASNNISLTQEMIEAFRHHNF